MIASSGTTVAGALGMSLRVSPILVAAALSGAVASSACSDITGPSTDGPTLSGPWALVALQPSGQPEATPPAGSRFAFEIVESRAAVTADCNRCGGDVTLEGNTVTMGPALACTRAFCSSAPFDDTFVRLLAGTSTASIDQDVLTLRSERGLLRFQHTK
jgi:heat shock protein HslJ